MPKRIQRKRTAGWKMPKNAVYVGRPTKWGNPYKLITDPRDRCGALGWLFGVADTPRHAVIFFESYIRKEGLQAKVRKELRGKNLACWCRLDQPCHADVLLRIANK